MAQMPIHCRWYNYMLHGLPCADILHVSWFARRWYNFMLHGLLAVTLQSTQHEVILQGLQEAMSECQVQVSPVITRRLGGPWISFAIYAGRALTSSEKKI